MVEIQSVSQSFSQSVSRPLLHGDVMDVPVRWILRGMSYSVCYVYMGPAHVPSLWSSLQIYAYTYIHTHIHIHTHIANPDMLTARVRANTWGEPLHRSWRIGETLASTGSPLIIKL